MKIAIGCVLVLLLLVVLAWIADVLEIVFKQKGDG